MAASAASAAALVCLRLRSSPGVLSFSSYPRLCWTAVASNFGWPPRPEDGAGGEGAAAGDDASRVFIVVMVGACCTAATTASRPEDLGFRRKQAETRMGWLK